MTVLDSSNAGPALRNLPLVTTAFAATVFLSAALLFFLEPMFAKMVLPLLGGSAAVWSVAMVVFQGLLLAGYLYAHLLNRHLPLRIAVLVHALVLATALLALPIAVRAAVPPASGVSFWLIGLFLASVGLPCFALSANAPLLQAWFARLSPDAYFLYRASNLGSFAILILYPFAIEPEIGLGAQSHLWSAGYALLAVAVTACAMVVTQVPSQSDVPVPRAAIRTAWRDNLAWIALAFVPSGLLVAVTAHIATDVASAPFLWIVPLALYLLTFVFVFADRPVISPRVLSAIQPASVAMLAILFLWSTQLPWGLTLAGHLGAFFVAAMVCHGRLYARRPEPAQLTSFYVWMSLGGVLGGAFAALLAPAIFTTVAEYPLLVFAALLLRADVWRTSRTDWLRDGAFLVAIAAGIGLALWLAPNPVPVFVMAVVALAGLMAASGSKPSRFLPLAALLLVATNQFDPSQSIVSRARSFYGVYKIVDLDGGRLRVLYHGTTAHGAERMRDDVGRPVTGKPEPLTYYYPDGPYAEALRAARTFQGGTLHNVALVGLGTGALSCYAAPGEHWTFYELDPLDVMLAHDPKLFQFVTQCAPKVTTVIGDGRLTLGAGKADIDLLLLDAFSSDAVPTHMLTREAFALYKRRLTPHGVIAINISNQHLQLSDVVAAAAAANGMVVAVRRDPRASDRRTLYMRAEIAVVTKSRSDLVALKLGRGWRMVNGSGSRPWTDDYSAILDAILAKLRE